MGSIADVFFGFHGDDSQLQIDATKAGTSAGDKAGGTFSDSFGKIVKTAAAAVIGAGIGLALKAITQGAVELDAATRKYAADTGATIEETKLAGEQISALFRTNVDSYGVIGDVLAKLRTDLHITGVEAQATAQEFLNFAHATGQEPVAATDALTTAIKAWQIPASQIPGLMDEIVRGHQLYGGSVADNVAVLARLAPALTAANMGVQDATGLLNLFSAAGLDSSKVALAFQTALKKVKSPQELADLIAQIQSTPDAFQRAQLATALFGARAGPQLAEALAPGTKALADYQISASDAAGATDTAAAAIDQGFGNQVVLAFHKVQDSLSGLATEISPVIYILDALGNMGINVLPMLGASLGALAPKIKPYLLRMLPVFAETGAAAGAAAGAAEVATETTAVVAGQAVVATAAVPAAGAAGTVIGGAMGAAIAIAIPLLILGAVAAAASAAEPAIHDFAIWTHDQIFGQNGPFDGVGAWMDDLSWPLGPKNTPKVDIGPFENIFGGIPPAATDAGNQAGQDINLALANSITTSGRLAVDAAAANAGAIGQAMQIPFTAAASAAAAGLFAAFVRTDKEFAAAMMLSFSNQSTAFKTQWSELDAIATGTADDIYGKQIRASNLAANTDAINAAQAIINSKASTAQQKSDAAARLLALQQEGLGIKIEMAGRGELSAAAYRQLIATLTTQANSNNKEVANSAKLALAELAKLKAAINDLPDYKIYGGKGTTKKNAAGGPVMAGDISTLGEKGPEIGVFAANGYVLTHQEAIGIAAGKYAPAGGSPQASSGPLIGQQVIYGVQPDDIERQTLRAMRRNQLQLSLAGGRR